MIGFSVSNIAWDAMDDNGMYEYMQKTGFSGLEIAPTRIFPFCPYMHLKEAEEFSHSIKNKYGLTVSSLQSIWFGRNEKLFGTPEEREILLQYTKAAIDFVGVMQCKNLVFGCPKNRFLPETIRPEIAESFFYELGEYAREKGTCLSMEANPVIYNTNYINTTRQSFDLAKKVNSPGFRVNLDLGTLLENGETLGLVADNLNWIQHVHVSEPHLKKIRTRSIHRELAGILNRGGYQGYVSIEMGRQENTDAVKECMAYVKEIFL